MQNVFAHLANLLTIQRDFLNTLVNENGSFEAIDAAVTRIKRINDVMNTVADMDGDGLIEQERNQFDNIMEKFEDLIDMYISNTREDHEPDATQFDENSLRIKTEMLESKLGKPNEKKEQS